MFLKSIYVGAGLELFSCFIAKHYSIEQIDYMLFIHSPIYGHQNCLMFMAIMSDTSINIHIQVFA